MKKYISLIVLSTILCFIARAQDSSELPDLVPLSPEAASLGKYGQIPVGLFTGTAQYNIPIHQFKSGPLTVPISINYSSNGVRVDEYSSSVGLGWSLIAGGVITRSVYGKRDENQYFPASSVNFDSGEDQYNFVTQASHPDPFGIDTAPDIFSFNFNGYSGKFYLDDNDISFYSREVVFLEPSPLKVELIFDNPSTHFKIIDPSGVVYFFGQNDAIEKFRNFNTNQADNSEPQPNIATAWYLTKIIHPLGEEITFSYDKGSLIYENGISQSVTREDRISIGTACGGAFQDTPSLNIAIGNFCYLTEIVSTNSGKVTFSYSQKASSFTGLKKLDKIRIEAQNAVLVKSFDLDYLVSNSMGSINPDIFTPKDEYRYRYFLSSVTEKSPTGATLPPFLLEYDAPGDLPPRFSYAQDYWGFYNGKHLNRNLIDQKTIDALAGNFTLRNALNSFEGADRSPDSNFGKKGILKKITYPTLGSNELFYEGHSYYGEVTTLPPLVSAQANVSNTTQANNSFTIQNVKFDHKGTLSFGADINDFIQQETNGNNTLGFNVAEVRVYDITGATDVLEPIFFETDILCISPFLTPYSIDNNNFTKRVGVKLKKDHSYRFEIQLSPGYSTSFVKLDYHNTLPVTTLENIPVGGVRIKKVNALDGFGKIETKEYYYGTKDCLDCSSGTVINRNLEASISVSERRFCTGPPVIGISCPTTTCGNTTISSNTSFPIFGIQGYYIGYSDVIESIGENFANGGVHHEFEGNFAIAPTFSVVGEFIQGTRFSNFFNFGRQLKSTIFRKENSAFIPLQETINHYTHDPAFDKETIAYAVRQRMTFLQGVVFISTNFSIENSWFDVTGYSLLRQWHYMSGRTTIQYDDQGENPVTTIETYYYDNTDHLQQTRSEVTDSKGNLIKTETKFPQDLVTKTAAEQLLIDTHRIAMPIEQATTQVTASNNHEELLSEVKTKYTNFGNGIIVPEEVFTQKGNFGIVEDRLVYHSYDDLGNPLEVSRSDGAHIIYVWGYKQQYPIAKIENASYQNMPNEASTIINQIRIASNTEDSPAKEQQIKTLFQNLRSHPFFNDAMVSTYIYNPLVGVTSMTDPRGYTMYYEYDTHNRLKRVKDQDGNIISENEYHYATKE